MADIPLGSTVAPGGPFEIARDTDIQGGHQSVADAAARDAIIPSRKKLGMFVTTQDDGKVWQLTGIGPDVWTEFTGGADVADWPITTVRRFAISYDNGDDNDAGYSDADLPTAGLVAKKHWEAFLAILPRDGNGRMFEVVLEQRAGGIPYKDITDTVDLSALFTQYHGYSKWGIRGTVTDATANSVAFAGDSNDHIMLGFRRASGTNAAGYRITKIDGPGVVVGAVAATVEDNIEVEHDGTFSPAFATGQRIQIDGVSDSLGGPAFINGIWTITVVDATHFTLDNTKGASNWPGDMSTSTGNVTRWDVVKADGSAAGLGVETSAVNGRWRWRGDVANATVTTQNQVFQPRRNGTNTIAPGPAVTDPTLDFWYIEEPGVCFHEIQVSQPVRMPADLNNFGQIGGIRTNTAGSPSPTFNIDGVGQVLKLVGIQGRRLQVRRCSDVSFLDTWSSIDAVPVLQVVGFGARITTNQIVYQDVDKLFIYRSHTPIIATAIGVKELTYQESKLNAIGIEGSVDTVSKFSVCHFRSNIVVNTADGRHEVVVDDGFWDGGVGNVFIADTGADNVLFRCSNIRDVRTNIGVGLGGGGVDFAVWFVDGKNCRVEIGGPNVWLRGTLAETSGFLGDRGDWVTGNQYTTAWNAFDPLYGELRDEDDNVFIMRNDQHDLVHLTPTPTPVLGFTDDVADIEQYNLVHPTAFPGAVFPAIPDYGLAKANSLAGASGPLAIALNRAPTGFSSVGSSGVAATIRLHRVGPKWIRSDDLPAAVGDIVYLSTANAGNAQAAVPAVVGTNQKRRIGLATAWRTTGGVNFILVDFKPEMLSVDADGNP